jgi:hypothetical protein
VRVWRYALVVALMLLSGMMTSRRPCPPAPGPLEAYAANFDQLLRRLLRRHGFRDHLIGLLTPHERTSTKTLTALPASNRLTVSPFDRDLNKRNRPLLAGSIIDRSQTVREQFEIRNKAGRIASGCATNPGGIGTVAQPTIK